jgi:hypothetical protein
MNLNLKFNKASIMGLFGKKGHSADHKIGHPSRDWLYLFAISIVLACASLAYHVVLFLDANATLSPAAADTSAPPINEKALDAILSSLNDRAASFAERAASPPSVPDPSK